MNPSFRRPRIDPAIVECSEEVADALASNAAVVALESTILAHGFAPPDGRELADDLERAVRQAGGIPATIAVLDGRLRVGLSTTDLDRLTDSQLDVEKAAALDLAIHCARGTHAATTVSATLAIARSIGIRVFATGGIGGVHRGDDGDISSDLVELSQSDVVVVSAGAKSILDIGRTVEALESLGVLVIGYRTNRFPAFYLPSSPHALAHRCDDFAEIADIARTRFDRLMQGGVLVCNPIDRHMALDESIVADAIDAAVLDARGRGLSGKKLTPYLLAAIVEKTGGQATQANRALAIANARVAAEISVAYRLVEPQP